MMPVDITAQCPKRETYTMGFRYILQSDITFALRRLIRMFETILQEYIHLYAL